MTEQTKPEESSVAAENTVEKPQNVKPSESPNKPEEPNGCCGSCS